MLWPNGYSSPWSLALLLSEDRAARYAISLGRERGRGGGLSQNSPMMLRFGSRWCASCHPVQVHPSVVKTETDAVSHSARPQRLMDVIICIVAVIRSESYLLLTPYIQSSIPPNLSASKSAVANLSAWLAHHKSTSMHRGARHACRRANKQAMRHARSHIHTRTGKQTGESGFCRRDLELRRFTSRSSFFAGIGPTRSTCSIVTVQITLSKYNRGRLHL